MESYTLNSSVGLLKAKHRTHHYIDHVLHPIQLVRPIHSIRSIYPDESISPVDLVHPID